MAWRTPLELNYASFCTVRAIVLPMSKRNGYAMGGSTVRERARPQQDGAPPGFFELREYFKARSQLTSALDIARGTLSSWENRACRTFRGGSVRDVQLLLRACQEVEPWMPSKAAVGAWLTTTQPQFGEAPVALLRREGQEGLDTLTTMLLASIPPTRTQRRDDLPPVDPDVRVSKKKVVPDLTAFDAPSDVRQEAYPVDMAPANKRTVTPRDNGWSVEKPGAKRASSVHETQREAVAAARTNLKNDGGGELAIKGRDGAVRAQDTIKPGNDPRRSKG